MGGSTAFPEFPHLAAAAQPQLRGRVFPRWPHASTHALDQLVGPEPLRHVVIGPESDELRLERLVRDVAGSVADGCTATLVVGVSS